MAVAEPWHAPRRCPVCREMVNRNRKGQLKQHMWNRQMPRKNPGPDDPFTKQIRSKCPASGMTVA